MVRGLQCFAGTFLCAAGIAFGLTGAATQEVPASVAAMADLPTRAEMEAAFGQWNPDEYSAENVQVFATLRERFLRASHELSTDAIEWAWLVLCETTLGKVELHRTESSACIERATQAMRRPMPDSSKMTLYSLRAAGLKQQGLGELALKDADKGHQLALQHLRESEQNGRSPHVTQSFEAFTVLADCRMAIGQYEESIGLLTSLIDPEPAAWLRDKQVGLIYKRLALSSFEQFLAGEEPDTARAREYGRLAAGLLPEGKTDWIAMETRRALLDLVEEQPEAALERLRAVEAFGSDSWNLDDVVWFEALRARAARELGRPEASALDAAWENLLASWRESTLETGEGFLRYGRRRFAVAELIRTTIEVAGVEAALDRYLALAQVGAMFRATGADSLDLQAFRTELLPPGTGALVIAPGKLESHLFVVDAEAVMHLPLPGKYALKLPVQNLWGDVANAAEGGEYPADDLEAFAASWLGAARGRIATWDRVLVMGRAFLWQAPLELLPVEGKPLGLRSAMSELSSPGVGVALHSRWLERQGTGALRGARFASDPDIPPDVLSEEGLSPLNRVAPRDLPSLHRLQLDHREGANATPGSLLEAPRPELLQVVTHGYRGSQGEGGVLALAPDGPASNGTLAVSSLLDGGASDAAPIVLLTTCHGQAGLVRWGDADAGHLGGAFVRRGAEAVVLSRESARVRQSSALEFAEALTAGLLTHEPIDEAMLRARRTLARKHGERGLAQGAMWGLLGAARARLQSEAGEPIGAPWSRRPMVLGSLLAGVALVLLLGYRKRSRTSG